MTRSCCPSCRVRFSSVTAVQLPACPLCGAPLEQLAAGARLGFRLLAVDGTAVAEQAIAVSVALPAVRPHE